MCYLIFFGKVEKGGGGVLVWGKDFRGLGFFSVLVFFVGSFLWGGFRVLFGVMWLVCVEVVVLFCFRSGRIVWGRG